MSPPIDLWSLAEQSAEKHSDSNDLKIGMQSLTKKI